MKFFISSTFEDLKEYRRIAIDMIADITHGCTGSTGAMEYFAATENTCKEECLQQLADSDLVVGIYGDRYGSIAEGTSISMTELEFDTAEELGIPILGFVPYSNTREERESQFIHQKVFARGKSCGRFSNLKEFAECLNKSLKEYFSGLEGFSYASIWDRVESAISKASQNPYPVKTFGPNQEIDALNTIIDKMDAIENVISAYGRGERIGEYIYIGLDNIRKATKSAALYLKLIHAQKRLLIEPWTSELREEVITALHEYTEYLERTNMTD